MLQAASSCGTLDTLSFGAFSQNLDFLWYTLMGMLQYINILQLKRTRNYDGDGVKVTDKLTKHI